jgi:hypothetical protein
MESNFLHVDILNFITLHVRIQIVQSQGLGRMMIILDLTMGTFVNFIPQTEFWSFVIFRILTKDPSHLVIYLSILIRHLTLSLHVVLDAMEVDMNQNQKSPLLMIG